MNFIKKECKKCKQIKKFLQGTERDKLSICGDCWDWNVKNNNLPQEQQKL